MPSVLLRPSNDIAPLPAKASAKAPPSPMVSQTMSPAEAIRELASLMSAHSPAALKSQTLPGTPNSASACAASASSHFGVPFAFPTAGLSSFAKRDGHHPVLETLTGGKPITVSDLLAASHGPNGQVLPVSGDRAEQGHEYMPMPQEPEVNAEPELDAPGSPSATTPDDASPRLSRAEQSRLNGAKSRGPVTPEGKANSSRNAFKHGLRSQSVLIPGEDPAEYQAFAAGICDDLQPVGTLQSSFARRAAEISWRLERLPAIESAVLAGCAVPLDDAEAVAVNPGTPLDGLVGQLLGVHNDGVLLRLQRYEVRLERSLSACLRELRMLQGGSSSKAARAQAAPPGSRSPSSAGSSVCDAAVPAAAAGETPAPQACAAPGPRSPSSAFTSERPADSEERSWGSAIPGAASIVQNPSLAAHEVPTATHDAPTIVAWTEASSAAVSGSFGTDTVRADTLSGSFGTTKASIGHLSGSFGANASPMGDFSGSFGTIPSPTDEFSGSFGTEVRCVAGGTGYTPSPLVHWKMNRLSHT